MNRTGIRTADVTRPGGTDSTTSIVATSFVFPASSANIPYWQHNHNPVCTSKRLGCEATSRCSLYRVNHATLPVHADVGLHPKISLVALLRLMYFGITLPFFVLCGTGGCDDGGIDNGSFFHEVALS